MIETNKIKNPRDKVIVIAYQRLGSLRKTSEFLGIPRSIISDVINRYKSDPIYIGKERRGRKKVLTERGARKLQLLVSKNPYLKLSELVEIIPGGVSRSTICNFLKSSKYQFLLPKRVVFLSKEQKLARLNFCKHMVTYDFYKVVFTDEKKFNLDGPDGLQRAWVSSETDRQLLQRRQNWGESLMVHATICSERLISVVEMIGNYTSKYYCEMLESQVFPLVRIQFGTRDFIWQHDNASIHSSRETRIFFERSQIQVLPWPAKSPDLNPVENFFAEMTRLVYKDNTQFNLINEL